MLEPIYILAFIFVPVRPSENSFAFNNAIFPLADVFTIINIGKRAFTIEFAVLEISFVDARV